MKVESIQAARAAYDIEAQCILEMKDYFDEVAFSRAVHLLAQARSLQYAALIDGFQHDGIKLVRPGQREQALGGFLHAGKALAERIDDRLEAPGQAVDLDFHRVQLNASSHTASSEAVDSLFCWAASASA